MSDLFTQRDKRRAGAVVKGANTGIAQALGFPVDMLNQAPLLINLLPGKQGMKPFSENPVGGSQMFKDAMAAGNIGTYKDVGSIRKDERFPGILGMLSTEALLSMFPVKKAADALMAIKKGKKDTLPALTAGGVDLSKRDLFKQAGAAAVSAAMAPSILREAGDIISTPGVARVGKTAVSSSAIIAKSRDLASQISDFMIESLIKKTKKGEKPSTKQLDAKTAEYNKVLDDLLKGKDYDALIKLPKNDLADLYNQKNFSAHKGAGDPLRSKEYGPLLDRVFKDKGIGLDSQGNYKKLIPNDGDPDPRNLLANPSAFDDAFGLKMFPTGGKTMSKPFQKRLPQSESLFPKESKRGRQLLIVSCSKDKCPDVGNMKALDRYTGMLFTKMKKAGIPPNVDVAILSAKHGLIRSDTPIENYNQLMTDEIRDSFLKNTDELRKIRHTMGGEYHKVFVTGGKNYKQVIEAAAKDLDYEIISEKAPGLTQKAVTKAVKEAGDFFHYTDYTEDQIKNFDIKFIEKKNRYGEWKDILGLHVGGRRSAEERGINMEGFTKSGQKKVTEEDLPGVFYSIELDTSKPYTNPYHKSGIWTEEELEDFITKEIIDNNSAVRKLRDAKNKAPNSEKLSFNDKIDKAEKEALSTWRKGLASRGFTNVPYINAQEDANSLSQIMLIDRPKGDKVIKSKLTGEDMAKGGVAGLSDIARDMFKGPKGIGTYESFMVG